MLGHADLVLADRRYYATLPCATALARANGGHARAGRRRLRAARSAPDRCAHGFDLGAGPLLTYVGRLDADKFALDLVECLALVRRRFGDAQLVVRGHRRAGALQMRERASELGIADAGCICWVCWTSTSCPTLLASSDVVVAPHMGYTLIEAGPDGRAHRQL